MASDLFFLSAGDPSGDNAASRLVSELRSIRPGLRLFGLGGKGLKGLGQEQLAEGNDLAVLGFWEVAKRYRFFRALMSRTVDEIKRRQPAAIILVDYPGFNLRLAERIKPLGIPIIYYISPQVWAWRRNRIKQISRLVDLMLLILPFEKQYYEGSSTRCEFVGHYLLEDIDPEMVCSKPPVETSLGLLPGSRPQEVERMLPVMLATARNFNRKYGTKGIVAGISGLFDYEKLLRPYATDEISIVYDRPREVIAGSSLVVTASGTATLEAAVIGRPMVVIYKTGQVTYQIARRLVELEMIGLVNLVLGARVVPELIQGAATPERIVAELENYYVDESYYNRTRVRLNHVPELLGGQGASARAAELIVNHV